MLMVLVDQQKWIQLNEYGCAHSHFISFMAISVFNIFFYEWYSTGTPIELVELDQFWFHKETLKYYYLKKLKDAKKSQEKLNALKYTLHPTRTQSKWKKYIHSMFRLSCGVFSNDTAKKVFIMRFFSCSFGLCFVQ